WITQKSNGAPPHATTSYVRPCRFTRVRTKGVASIIPSKPESERSIRGCGTFPDRWLPNIHKDLSCVSCPSSPGTSPFRSFSETARSLTRHSRLVPGLHATPYQLHSVPGGPSHPSWSFQRSPSVAA